jgi:hypothetical protein
MYTVVFNGWYARMASVLDFFFRARFCLTVKRTLSNFRHVGSHSITLIKLGPKLGRSPLDVTYVEKSFLNV